MPGVHIERHRDISVILHLRVNPRAARKTRPITVHPNHPTKRRPQIIVGDGEGRLGFLADGGFTAKTCGHVVVEFLSSYIGRSGRQWSAVLSALAKKEPVLSRDMATRTMPDSAEY